MNSGEGSALVFTTAHGVTGLSADVLDEYETSRAWGCPVTLTHVRCGWVEFLPGKTAGTAQLLLRIVDHHASCEPGDAA